MTTTRRLTTPEQDEYMRRHCKGKTAEKLIELMQNAFGITMTKAQMKGYKNRKKINTGLTGCFEKGHVPANKGKKLPPEIYTKCAATMFKKGNAPRQTRPVGAEQLRSDGYVWIKIAEPNKWRQKHVVIWEQAHGPRPAGHVVIFADQDHQNFEVDNLILATQAENLVANRHKLISHDADTTKTGLLLAKVIAKKSQLKKR